MRITSLMASALVVLLFASGCGSSDAESTPIAAAGVSPWTEVDASSYPQEVIDTADGLIAQHGESALRVLILALERGYDADQLASGATAGTVADNGTIAGVEPARTPADVVESASSAGALTGAGETGVTLVRFVQASGSADLVVDRLRSKFSEDGEDPDRLLALVIISAVGAGYSLGQIVDAIVLGDGLPGLAGCLYPPGGGLTPIRPDFASPDDPCHDDSLVPTPTSDMTEANLDEGETDQTGADDGQATNSTASDGGASELTDGAYSGSLADPFGFLGQASKIGFFSTRSEVAVNEATVVIADGSLVGFQAEVLTTWSCCLHLSPEGVDYTANYSFHFVADLGSAISDAGVITATVEVDATLTHSGPDAAQQKELEWDRLTTASLTITTTETSASLSLLNESGRPMVSILLREQ